MAPRWYAVLCWVLAALFAVCVALQHNDPDPVRWMALYAAAMIAAGALPATRALPWSRRGAALVAAVAVVWAAVLLARIWGVVSVADVTENMMAKGGAVEELREFGGLAIVAVSLVALAIVRGRWRPGSVRS